jgi:hypothetical protein
MSPAKHIQKFVDETIRTSFAKVLRQRLYSGRRVLREERGEDVRLPGLANAALLTQPCVSIAFLDDI